MLSVSDAFSDFSALHAPASLDPELFEHRDSSTLTLETYDRVGGVLGALGKRANRIFLTLTQDQQEAARQVFLRLVTVGDEGELDEGELEVAVAHESADRLVGPFLTTAMSALPHAPQEPGG